MKIDPVSSTQTKRISRTLQGTGEAPELTAVAPINAIPAGLVEDDEIIILFLRPSPLYIILASLGRLLVIAVITLSLMYVGRRFSLAYIDTIAFGLGVIIGLAQLAWQGLEWWSRIYILTDRRIIRQKGVLRPTVFSEKLRDIQHTSVFRKLRERAMGLGSIGFTATGSDVFDAFWVMIRDPFTVHKTVVDAIKRYGRH
ncbi:MAG: PH domain-containing protein [Planctomycetes bacterium]|nr:PH domain-containing protein [Planctomycetota bacterium]